MGLPLLAIDNEGERAFWCENAAGKLASTGRKVLYAPLAELHRAGLIQGTPLEGSQGAKGVAISSPHLVTATDDAISIFDLSRMAKVGNIDCVRPRLVALGAKHIVWVEGQKEEALRFAPLASPIKDITTIRHDHQDQRILSLAAGDDCIWLLTADEKLVKLSASAEGGDTRHSFNLPEEISKGDYKLSLSRIHLINRDALMLGQPGRLYYVRPDERAASLDVTLFEDPARGTIPPPKPGAGDEQTADKGEEGNCYHDYDYLVTAMPGWRGGKEEDKGNDLETLVIIGDPTSPDIVCGGIGEKREGEELHSSQLCLFFLQSEEGLPQLPLSRASGVGAEDTFPVAFALDFTNDQGQDSRPSDPDTSERLPPQPLLWVLTSEGRLCPFSIVKTDQKPAYPLMKHKVERVSSSSPSTDREIDETGEKGQQALETKSHGKSPISVAAPSQPLVPRESVPGGRARPASMGVGSYSPEISQDLSVNRGGGLSPSSSSPPHNYTSLEEILRERDQFDREDPNGDPLSSSYLMTTEDLGHLQNAIIKEALALREAWNGELNRLRYQSDDLYQSLLRERSLMGTELPALSLRLSQASQQLGEGEDGEQGALPLALEREGRVRSLITSLAALRLLASTGSELSTLAGQVQGALEHLEELVTKAEAMDDGFDQGEGIERKEREMKGKKTEERREYLRNTILPALESVLSLLPVLRIPSSVSVPTSACLNGPSVSPPMGREHLTRLHQRLRQRQPEDLITIAQPPPSSPSSSSKSIKDGIVSEGKASLDKLKKMLLDSLPPIPSIPPTTDPITTGPLEPAKVPARVKEAVASPLFAISSSPHHGKEGGGGEGGEGGGERRTVTDDSVVPSLQRPISGTPSKLAAKNDKDATSLATIATSELLLSSPLTKSGKTGAVMSLPTIVPGTANLTGDHDKSTSPQSAAPTTAQFKPSIASPPKLEASPSNTTAVLPSSTRPSLSSSASFGLDLLSVGDKDGEAKTGSGKEKEGTTRVTAVKDDKDKGKDKEQGKEPSGPSIFSLPTTVAKSGFSIKEESSIPSRGSLFNAGLDISGGGGGNPINTSTSVTGSGSNSLFPINTASVSGNGNGGGSGPASSSIFASGGTSFGQPSFGMGSNNGFGTFGSIISSGTSSTIPAAATGSGPSTFGAAFNLKPSLTSSLPHISHSSSATISAAPTFGQPTSFGFSAIPSVFPSTTFPATAPLTGEGFSAYAASTFGSASSVPAPSSNSSIVSSPFGVLAQQQQPTNTNQATSIFGPASAATTRKEETPVTGATQKLPSSFTQFRG